MSLSVGIVGLPNAGKSTLFNALAARRLAETAPRPFTTIEPHEAVVAVPDKELDKLWELVRGDPSTALRITEAEKVPASVTFIDIAGLVKGANKGEGLGNQFLGKIREVDAIVHVVRGFFDPAVSHPHATYEPGSKEQILEDIEIVNLELELGEISRKPTIYVLNVEEADSKNFDLIKAVEEKFSQKALLISAEVEEELIDFTQDERKSYLRQLGEERSALERLIVFAYELLDLISFYTIKGGKEVHAWSIKRGATALEAAGVVHTDFAKNFIKAEVINVEELMSAAPGPVSDSESLKTRGEGLGPGGAWKEAKDKGKVKLEGKDYIVQNRDVIEFKVGS